MTVDCLMISECELNSLIGTVMYISCDHSVVCFQFCFSGLLWIFFFLFLFEWMKVCDLNLVVVTGFMVVAEEDERLHEGNYTELRFNFG